MWECVSVDWSDKDLAVETAKLMHTSLLLKLFDLTETFFFVFRKKFNQISVLHVYHHISVPIASWVLAKYYGGFYLQDTYHIHFWFPLKPYLFFIGGVMLFPLILNNSVHVLMYLYYFGALFGTTVQRKLRYIKQNLTKIQMVTFLKGIIIRK